MQTASHIMMIHPVNFSFNAETAVNNAFQVKDPEGAQEKAEAEFNGFVTMLRDNGIDVLEIHDTPNPYTPDSIFPNNWISFHDDATICLYPMFAENRRKERKPEFVQAIENKFLVKREIDFTHFESRGRFLEGTGSMVLDRDYKIAYACLSPRTDKEVLEEFCAVMGYEAITFLSVDENAQPVYHTNVMMCVAYQYVVICMDSIPAAEHKRVAEVIRRSNKQLIEITLNQMHHFAGNMLQVQNNKGEKLLVMSTQAYRSLTAEQVDRLAHFNRIVHAPLNTIETNGGGSARCMMAEIFLPRKN